MDINRNHYFLVGLVVLLLGLQLRVVDSYVLNEQVTQIIEKRVSQSGSQPAAFFTSAGLTPSRRTIQLPEWSGWCLLSIGAVLILHSLAMQRPS